MPPKTAPIPRKAKIRTRRPGKDSAKARFSPVADGACGLGWVARWAAKSRPPSSVSVASVARPAAGWTPVHSAVARTGPTTKVNSSVTDSKAAAVGSRGEPSSLAAQRARTIGPTCGTEAPHGYGGQCQGPDRRAQQGERGQAADGGGVREDHGQQDGALAEAVGEDAHQGRGQRHGDAGDGGDDAGAAVGTGGVLDQQQDADGQHAEGESGCEAGEYKAEGAGRAQELPVAGAGGLVGRDRGCHGLAFPLPGRASPSAGGAPPCERPHPYMWEPRELSSCAEPSDTWAPTAGGSHGRFAVAPALRQAELVRSVVPSSYREASTTPCDYGDKPCLHLRLTGASHVRGLEIGMKEGIARRNWPN